MKCIVCKQEFEPKRVDARFCSDKCRKALSRTNKPDTIISDTIISDIIPDIIPDTGQLPDLGHIQEIDALQDGPGLAISDVTMPDIPLIHDLTNDMIESLPAGVCRPDSRPTQHTASLSAAGLYKEIRWAGTAWKQSPAYAELIYRLLTLEDLTEYVVPAWRINRCAA